MNEQQKADEMYNNAVKFHGLERAKEEVLKSAYTVHALAPNQNGKMKSRSYWEKVIEHLKKK